jgi:hypothetical protein
LPLACARDAETSKAEADAAAQQPELDQIGDRE